MCTFLSIIMAFGTFVTMTFGNIPLSDWIDVKEAFAATNAISPVPVFYRYGELVGIYRVNYTDKTKLQYKIGDNGTWTDYSVPFAIPAYKTTKLYTRVCTTGKTKYMFFSNTDQAGVKLGDYTYVSDAINYTLTKSNDTLTKSNDKTIEYYSNGRLKKITYDNGSWIQYTYTDSAKTYTTLTSSGQGTKTVYNDAFMPTEYTDEYGTTTSYTYDGHYRVLTKKQAMKLQPIPMIQKAIFFLG